MAGLQEKVRERIQASFVDLIPPEAWEELVRRELDAFVRDTLPNTIKAAAHDVLRERLRGELAKPEWQPSWDGSTGKMVPSEMVADAVKEAAPALVAAMFGSMAQQFVDMARNGSLARY
ncbi:MAG: hypothetical protein ACK5XA_08665 [Tagaea sp.]